MTRTLALLAVAGLIACDSSTPEPAPTPAEPEAPKVDPADQALLDKAKGMLQPLPKAPVKGAVEVTPELVSLGQMLYHETRLSAGHDISCNSCHQVDNFGVDSEATSPGFKGQRGDRNSPTSFNAALHVAQFWDGRAADLEEQAKGPVLNPIEMAMTDEPTVVATLESIPGYAEPFAKAFPGSDDPITYDNMATAIGAFERTLITPSKFDAFLEGDLSALNAEEKKGLELYLDTGCTTCHMGPALGGQTYMKLGLVKPWETEDVGRFKVTNNEADKYVFKVPSLRNIEKTGPYLHDGSVADLDEMIKLMADHQLGKQLSDDEVKSIRTFLGTLTGEPTPEMTKVPELPESGPDTPKPAAG